MSWWRLDAPLAADGLAVECDMLSQTIVGRLDAEIATVRDPFDAEALPRRSICA